MSFVEFFNICRKPFEENQYGFCFPDKLKLTKEMKNLTLNHKHFFNYLIL